MLISARVIHVATDWPAFGLFFIGLITVVGGGVGWVLRRIDKNRAEWKEFVAHEVQTATAGIQADVQKLSTNLETIARDVVEQGRAISRIEGSIFGSPFPVIPVQDRPKS